MKEKIKVAQIGIIPHLIRWVGIIWIGCFGLAGFMGIMYWALDKGAQYYDPVKLITGLVVSLVTILAVFVLPFAIIGILIGGMFPSIWITKHGMEYKYLWVKGFIHWTQMKYITTARRWFDCFVLVIDPSVTSPIMMWIATMHGMLTGFFGTPVLLLSVSGKTRDRLAKSIQEKQAAIFVQESTKTKGEI